MIRILTFIFFICLTSAANAQSIDIDLGQGGSATSNIIKILGLLTVLSLAPSILIMVTSFTRIVVVLAFLRTAMGLQTTPPNSVIISLALFLTFFIMSPVFEQSYEDGIKPLIDERITEEQAFDPITKPFHSFMMKQTRDKDLSLFLDIAKIEKVESPEAVPLKVLIPSFMISELRRAFEIGFLIFIPFLIIDMIVASTLMSMGMMMLPPVLISLPFKIIFFVLVDGWYMIIGSLVKSFN